MDRKKVDEILLLRARAREENNWEESDRLRKVLNDNGYSIEDTLQGQVCSGGTEALIRELNSKISSLEYTLRREREDNEYWFRELRKLQQAIAIFKGNLL